MRNIIIILLFPLFCFPQANNSIKAYWRLDGNATDVSGNSNTGTGHSNTYAMMSGKFNQGTYFNGSAYITFSNSASLKPTTGLTISMWVKRASSTATHGIISNYNNVGGNWGYKVLSVGHTVDFFIDAGGGNVQISGGSIDNGNWRYLVCVWDGSYGYTYIDGVLAIAPQAASALAYSATTYPCLGADAYSGSYNSKFVGYLDEVIVDNTGWSAAKVGWMYNQYLGVGLNMHDEADKWLLEYIYS